MQTAGRLKSRLWREKGSEIKKQAAATTAATVPSGASLKMNECVIVAAADFTVSFLIAKGHSSPAAKQFVLAEAN